MSMKTFQDVIAWQRSIELAKRIYTLTKHFPDSERFGLSSQMRRCAVSIPSNIAEGYHRSSRSEFRRFCFIAYGSAAELQTQLIIAKSQDIAPPDEYRQIDALLLECNKLLNSLCRSLG